MAERLGVLEETVGLWERGLRRPLPGHYGAIVGFLSYDPEAAPPGLAGRLKAVRLRLGLTQAELAARAGLDEGSICRWESGWRQPSRWMAGRLTLILDRLENRAGEPSGAAQAASELPALSYFDRTRWRRRPPPDLTEGAPRTLGDRLRHRRLELGLSQEEAAKRLGVTRGAIYRWERGLFRPPRTHLAALRRFVRSQFPASQDRRERSGLRRTAGRSGGLSRPGTRA